MDSLLPPLDFISSSSREQYKYGASFLSKNKQCGGGAENISLVPASRSRKLDLLLRLLLQLQHQPGLWIVLKDTLKITFFDLSNRIKILTIFNISSATMTFSIKFLQVCGK